MNSSDTSLMMVDNDEEQHKGHNVNNNTSSWNQISSYGLLNLERTRQLMILRLQKYRERINMDTLRPLPLFLGINQSFCFAPDAFSPPIKHQHLKDLSRKSTFEKISQRFHLNFQFFLTNYFLIFIGIGVVVLCLNFQCLIYGGLVYGLWVGHDSLKGTSLHHEETNRPIMIQFQIYTYEINQNVTKYIPSFDTRTKVLYGLTLWVILYHCLRPFCTIVGLTFLMVTFHAVMRDPRQVESASIKVVTGDHYGKYKKGTNDKDDDDDDENGNSSEDSGVIV